MLICSNVLVLAQLVVLNLACSLQQCVDINSECGTAYSQVSYFGIGSGTGAGGFTKADRECVCKPGFVSNHELVCNADITYCSNDGDCATSETCEQYIYSNRPSVMSRKCFCKPGFSHKSETGLCIIDEQYCQSSADCGDNQNCNTYRRPDHIKTKHCKCKSGYIWNDVIGTCSIDAQLCSDDPECSDDEICRLDDDQCKSCLQKFRNHCFKGKHPERTGLKSCHCRRGLVRSNDGSCVSDVRFCAAQVDCGGQNEICESLSTRNVSGCDDKTTRCYCKMGYTHRGDNNCAYTICGTHRCLNAECCDEGEHLFGSRRYYCATTSRPCRSEASTIRLFAAYSKIDCIYF